MKKLVSIVLALVLFIPLSAFPVFSANNDYWTCYGGRFLSSTGEIWAPKPNAYEISAEGFTFLPDYDSGEIYVDHGTAEYIDGIYSTSAITSNTTLPLDELSVVIQPEEFDFDVDENGRSNMISVLWTENYITGLASSVNMTDYCGGLYNSDKVASGLKNIVRSGKGLCITLSNSDPDNVGTRIATDVTITYYDGSYTDGNGDPGYSWRFADSGIMPLSLDSIPYQYGYIDLSYGLVITVKSNDKLGYTININGKDYYGQLASYNPEGKRDIDLTCLCDIDGGFVTVGAVSVNDKFMPEHRCSYTFKAINNYAPYTMWDYLPAPHIHEYTQKTTQSGCTVNTIETYTCEECGDSFDEILPAEGHSYKESTVFATCTEEGYTKKVCRSCGDEIIVKTIPAKGHNYRPVSGTNVQVCSRCGDTTNPEIIPDDPPAHVHSYSENRIEPSCENDGNITYICSCGHSYGTVIAAPGHTEGRRVEKENGDIDIYCLVCDEYMYTKTGFKPHVHFIDVKKGHWFYDSVCYVNSKGYMYGMTETTFAPNGTLTREQFVTILANMAGVDTDEYKDEQLMSDVKPVHWFAGSVNWAVKEGYVAGVAKGVFGVGQPIQRAALARLLYLYAEKNGKETDTLEDLSGYTDFEKVEDWMAEGLGWAVRHGIITSAKDDSLTLDPKGIATRAQCARMLTVYDSIPDDKADIIIPEIPPEYDPDPEPDPIPEPDPDSEPDPVPGIETEVYPVPDYTPLEINTDVVKEWLVEMNVRGATGAYKYNGMSLKLFYSPEDDDLFALYGTNVLYDFSGDTVEILRYGNTRPLFEIWNDYELALPYMEVYDTARLTSSGIVDSYGEYTLGAVYLELIDILGMIGALE